MLNFLLFFGLHTSSATIENQSFEVVRICSINGEDWVAVNISNLEGQMQKDCILRQAVIAQRGVEQSTHKVVISGPNYIISEHNSTLEFPVNIGGYYVDNYHISMFRNNFLAFQLDIKMDHGELFSDFTQRLSNQTLLRLINMSEYVTVCSCSAIGIDTHGITNSVRDLEVLWEFASNPERGIDNYQIEFDEMSRFISEAGIKLEPVPAKHRSYREAQRRDSARGMTCRVYLH